MIGPAHCVLPAQKRFDGCIAVHLPLGGVHRVSDGGHAVVGADGDQVRRRIGTVGRFPADNERIVLRIVEVGAVVAHGDEADCGIAHALQHDVLTMSPVPISLMPAARMPSAA